MSPASFQSGNHPNWVTVSRTMTGWAKTAASDAEKGVPKRESNAAAAAAGASSSGPNIAVDFYSQKNCAAQYNLLLKLVEPATPHGRRTKRYIDSVVNLGDLIVIYIVSHPFGRKVFLLFSRLGCT